MTAKIKAMLHKDEYVVWNMYFERHSTVLWYDSGLKDCLQDEHLAGADSLTQRGLVWRETLPDEPDTVYYTLSPKGWDWTVEGATFGVMAGPNKVVSSLYTHSAEDAYAYAKTLADSGVIDVCVVLLAINGEEPAPNPVCGANDVVWPVDGKAA